MSCGYSEVQPLLAAAANEAMANGILSKPQLDTYQREIERYGGDEGMVLTERLFSADSAGALEIIASFEGETDLDARFRLTLRGMDQLLDDLQFTLAEKCTLLINLSAGRKTEFFADARFERQLGEHYRRERLHLESLLDRSVDPSSPFAPALATFKARSERLRPVAEALRQCASAGYLKTSLAELAGSFLHMHANRMLRSAARAQELVLYDFLGRLYKGQIARAGTSTT